MSSSAFSPCHCGCFHSFSVIVSGLPSRFVVQRIHFTTCEDAQHPFLPLMIDMSMLWKYLLMEDCFLKDSPPDFVTAADLFVKPEWIFNNDKSMLSQCLWLWPWLYTKQSLLIDSCIIHQLHCLFLLTWERAQKNLAYDAGYFNFYTSWHVPELQIF